MDELPPPPYSETDPNPNPSSPPHNQQAPPPHNQQQPAPPPPHHPSVQHSQPYASPQGYIPPADGLLHPQPIPIHTNQVLPPVNTPDNFSNTSLPNLNPNPNTGISDYHSPTFSNNVDNGVTPPGSAAQFFEMRLPPAGNHGHAEPVLSHMIVVDYDLNIDGLEYPTPREDWEAQNIDEQDWKTFVNYLRPDEVETILSSPFHSMTIGGEGGDEKKGGGEKKRGGGGGKSGGNEKDKPKDKAPEHRRALSEPVLMPGAFPGAVHHPSDQENGIIGEEIPEEAVAHREETEDMEAFRRAETRRIEGVVREWNEGFFLPRGVRIELFAPDVDTTDVSYDRQIAQAFNDQQEYNLPGAFPPSQEGHSYPPQLNHSNSAPAASGSSSSPRQQEDQNPNSPSATLPNTFVPPMIPFNHSTGTWGDSSTSTASSRSRWNQLFWGTNTVRNTGDEYRRMFENWGRQIEDWGDRLGRQAEEYGDRTRRQAEEFARQKREALLGGGGAAGGNSKGKERDPGTSRGGWHGRGGGSWGGSAPGPWGQGRWGWPGGPGGPGAGSGAGFPGRGGFGGRGAQGCK